MRTSIGGNEKASFTSRFFSLKRLPLVLLAIFLIAATATAASILLIGKQPDGSVLVPSNQVIRGAGTAVELNQRPLDIALRPDGKQIAAITTRYTFLIDTQTGQVTNRFDGGARSFAGLAYSPDGKYLFYAKGGSQQIGFAKINADGTATHADSDNISITTQKTSNGNGWLSYPAGLSVSPDGKKLYVAMFGSNEMGIVDLATMKQTGSVDTGSTPFGAYISPDGSKVFVSNWGGPLPKPNEPPQNVGLRYPIKQDPQTGVTAAGSISVYDVTTGKMENDAIKTGLHPTSMTFDKKVSRLYVTNSNEDTVSVINLKNSSYPELERIPVRPLKKLPFGSMPNGIALDEEEGVLYVANGGNNAVAVIDLSDKSSPVKGDSDDKDDKKKHHLEEVGSFATLAKAQGDDDNGKQDEENKSELMGFIPTEWFPVGVLLNKDTSKLYVANNKGTGSLAGTNNPDTSDPNGYPPGYQQYYGQPTVPGKYVKSVTGSVSFIKTPEDNVLKDYTQQVLKNSNYVASLMKAQQEPRKNIKPVPVPERIGEPSVFKHVVYVIKENRTYDQVLGDLGRGNGDPMYANFPEYVTPNQHKLANQYGVLDNFYTSTLNSADGHQWTDEAIANIFMERIYNNYPTNGEPLHGSYGDNNLSLTPLSLYENAMIHKKTVTNFGESGGDEAFTTIYKNGVALPHDSGYSWTELYQDYLAVKAGAKPVFTYDTVAFPPPLDRAINRKAGFQARSYANYDELVSDQIRYNFWENDFDLYVKNNNLPDLMVIALPQDHTSGGDGEQPTPRAMVADNDLALGKIVDRITNSKYGNDTVIFVVEDDSQSGVDHVDGHRTIAYAISAYNKQGNDGKGIVDSTLYNHTSMVRTIEQILGIPPMNQYDLTATLMTNLFQEKPNFSNKYTYKPSNLDITCLNKEFFAPTPGKNCAKEIGYTSKTAAMADAKTAAGLNKIRDGNDAAVMDQIIWRATMGDTPMPTPKWKKELWSTGSDGDDDDD